MWIYIAHCHKVSNALGTLVPAEKPSFQTLSEGLIVLLKLQDHEHPTSVSCGVGVSLYSTDKLVFILSIHAWTSRFDNWLHTEMVYPTASSTVGCIYKHRLL